MSSVLKEALTVGGLPIEVYHHTKCTDSPGRPVAVLFLLHGRFGSVKYCEPIAQSVVTAVYKHPEAITKDLYIVAFDHRNHGHRLADPKANYAWSTQAEKNNDRHALDMYAVQVGTTKDVSYLIDFLPSYLFSKGERSITDWGVAGVSLGGHSVWITLGQEPRIRTGIPVIGCPDYLALIERRAKEVSLTLKPPYLPDDLFGVIKRSDPASQPYSALDASNPFLGKNILVLSGGADKLVPWQASEEFVNRLEVGTAGRKIVKVYDGIGHECTEEMVGEMARFVGEVMCQ